MPPPPPQKKVVNWFFFLPTNQHWPTSRTSNQVICQTEQSTVGPWESPVSPTPASNPGTFLQEYRSQPGHNPPPPTEIKGGSIWFTVQATDASGRQTLPASKSWQSPRVRHLKQEVQGTIENAQTRTHEEVAKVTQDRRSTSHCQQQHKIKSRFVFL